MIIKRVICLFLLLQGISLPALADYTNPTLKVLLFISRSGIELSSRSWLELSDPFIPGSSENIIIKPYSDTSLVVNGYLVKKPLLYIDSPEKISVKKLNSSFHRSYHGRMQIVAGKGGMYIINHVPTETYLEGVLNAEINTNWPIEAVKAQAVIARTFALFKREQRKEKLWHISAGEYDQVYKGDGISDERGKRVIELTYGIIVSYRGRLAQTFYHSNCGGITENPSSLWKGSYPYPYLKVKSVPYGKSDPRFQWQASISNREILQVLKKSGIHLTELNHLSIGEYTPSGRVKNLVFNKSPAHAIPAETFRRLTGYRRIQSLLFDVVRIPGGYFFKGRGNGHGVGLSQWSAKEMAEVGYRYHEILHFFYHDIKLAHYWN